MRTLHAILILSAITSSTSFAAPGSGSDSTSATPPLQLAAWKSDFNATANDHLADLPPVLTPVDSSTSAEVPQSVPVEAIPTPTAVTSGLMVLGGLAAVRIYRRLHLA
jgi:hypothetical protein